MNTIGFVISRKKNEKRRAIVPEDIKNIKNKKNVYIEKGYGEILGITDEEYKNMGVNVVPLNEVLTQDIICDPKIGEADYIEKLSSNQIIFGWMHAESNSDLVEKIINKKITAIAWEEMYHLNRHVFWKNNEIAGETAILHAFTLLGKSPSDCYVALIGKGNVSMGAYRMLSSLSSKVKIFDRKNVSNIREELQNFDMVVNGVLWDKKRNDHLIYRDDLKKFKKLSMIVDISCDESGAIETSKPTTFENPIYSVDNVIHYVVDHTPTIFSHSVTNNISSEICKYIDVLIEDKIIQNLTLSDAIIASNGSIKDIKL